MKKLPWIILSIVVIMAIIWFIVKKTKKAKESLVLRSTEDTSAPDITIIPCESVFSSRSKCDDIRKICSNPNLRSTYEQQTGTSCASYGF